jgi:hypothetical protein
MVRNPASGLVWLGENARSSAANYVASHAKRVIEGMEYMHRQSIPVIDTYTPFATDPRGVAALVDGDGVHPHKRRVRLCRWQLWLRRLACDKKAGFRPRLFVW